MDAVLGTDTAHHFEYLSKFENRTSAGMSPDQLEKKEDVLLVITYFVKCADMSNSSRPAALNRMWVDRVMSEFFDQGDLEREKSFDVTMFYDRQKPNIPKCQTGFIDFLVRPMYLKLVNFTQHPAAKRTLDLLEENYLFWKATLEQNALATTLAGPSTAPFKSHLAPVRICALGVATDLYLLFFFL